MLSIICPPRADRSIRQFSLDAGVLQEVGRVAFHGDPQHLLCDNERPAMLVSSLLPGRSEHEIHIVRPHGGLLNGGDGARLGGGVGGEHVGGAGEGRQEWDVAKLHRVPPEAIAVGCWSLCGRNRVAIFDANCKCLKVFEFV